MVSRDIPGLYEWRIEGVGSYIGKYKNITRPTKHYGRIVTNLLGGKPYRKSKPEFFRRIHYELADAIRTGKTITLIIVENPSLPDMNQREQKLIKEHGTLNGGRVIPEREPCASH